MHCAQCGTPLQPGHQFCDECGTPAARGSAPAAAAQDDLIHTAQKLIQETADVGDLARRLCQWLGADDGTVAGAQRARPDLPPDLFAALSQALSENEEERFLAPAALMRALTNVATPYQLLTGSCTDRGTVRRNNQDCLYTATFSLRGGNLAPTTAGLYVLCDGMGGEAGGEIASGMTVQGIATSVSQFLTTRSVQEGAVSPAEVEQALVGALADANRSLREESARTPALFGMGTTMTALLAIGDRAVLVHVGDSRCYAWDESQGLRLLTEDQSLVGRMVASGQITIEEARHRPERSMLWQAVGSRDTLEPQVVHLQLSPGQRFALLSDGVHGALSEPEIGALLSADGRPQGTANALVNRALQAGSDDNASAIVLLVSSRNQIG